MKLIESIDKNGIPDSLIFSFTENQYYAIWGFDEILSIGIDDIDVNVNRTINLFQNKINDWKKNSSDVAAIGYFSYDAKKLFYPHIKFKFPNSSIPLIWFGKPHKIMKIHRDDIIKLKNNTRGFLKKSLNLKNIRHYKNKIKTIKSYLKAGDVYQINYTQPIEYNLEEISPFDLFIKLFNASKPKFGTYLNAGEFQILSMSPENFFTKIKNKISSSPIKGTSKRSDDPLEDKKLKQKLINSEKDKAEHIMIVDLIRNDLGKICNFGSIKTKNLFKVHSFKTIHHMITDISGKLKLDIQEKDIFQALFPGGSITGAPKESSMKIIDEIENYSREIYTGSIGLISSNNDMIFNIAIRTLRLINSKAIYPVGGGIVWDSKPEDERNEAIDKSAILNL
tara:strand:+ start:353 stop:1534 length:1182 start_codon:yes stop_codon:yes gene_type:complete